MAVTVKGRPRLLAAAAAAAEAFVGVVLSCSQATNNCVCTPLHELETMVVTMFLAEVEMFLGSTILYMSLLMLVVKPSSNYMTLHSQLKPSEAIESIPPFFGKMSILPLTSGLRHSSKNVEDFTLTLFSLAAL